MENEEKDKLKEFKGLTNNEVVISREKNGSNIQQQRKKESLIKKILNIFKEKGIEIDKIEGNKIYFINFIFKHYFCFFIL